MLNFDAHVKNSDAAQLRVTNVKTPNGTWNLLHSPLLVSERPFLTQRHTCDAAPVDLQVCSGTQCITHPVSTGPAVTGPFGSVSLLSERHPREIRLVAALRGRRLLGSGRGPNDFRKHPDVGGSWGGSRVPKTGC